MLPFGLRSSAKIFNAVADALEWRLKAVGVPYIHHYLADFVVLGAPRSDECPRALEKLLLTCSNLGIPLAAHKSEGPATTITFLGIVIDTLADELRLPTEKLNRIRTLLIDWGDKKACTRRDLDLPLTPPEPGAAEPGTGHHVSSGNGACCPEIYHKGATADPPSSTNLGSSMARPVGAMLLRQPSKAAHNFKLVATHITSSDNSVADDLSRDNLHSFFSKVPTANRSQEHVPETAVELLLDPEGDSTSPAWMHRFTNIFTTV
ncbi:hypothetical protein EMCRGX_G000045 [Ephydatia muelleri]